MITITSRTSATLRISVSCGDNTTIALEGELDMACTDVVEAAESLVPPYAAVVVVDLSGLTFVDHWGAEALAAVHAAHVTRGRRVSLTGARPTIRRIFGILDMTSLLQPQPQQRETHLPRHPRPPDWLKTTPLPLTARQAADPSAVVTVPACESAGPGMRPTGAAPGLCGWCGHVTHPGGPCAVHRCPCR